MKRLLCISAALAAMVLLGAKAPPTRLDVTAQPEGAQVFVDGQLRGIAPLQLFDVSPGLHLVHVQSPGYVAADEFVTIEEGGFVQKNWALQREKALLLLRTTPAGAEVRYNGVALGTTPLLSTTLNAGETYTFDLMLNGYRTKRIDVRLESRAPVVRDEELVLDSGIVKCTTDPPGAMVLVNGVERGVTPLVAEGVPKGLAMITFRLAGYREESRELRLAAGERRNLDVQLAPLPAALKVISTPEGARVFVDGNYQGKTPVTVTPLKPGARELKLELNGYATVTRTVNAANGADLTETVSMESVLGRIQVVTIPGGAKISLDGHAVGSTKARPGAIRSDVLLLNDLPAGEHSLVAHLDGYQDVSRRVKVDPKQSLEVSIRLPRVFTPDTEVETTHGTYRGVLVSSSPEGLTLEIRPGITQTIPQGDIRRKTPITQ
jgi:hypothetical protein